MIKWLLTIGIIYLIYRQVMAAPGLNRGEQQPPLKNNSSVGTKDEGEYIDYEEVD